MNGFRCTLASVYTPHGCRHSGYSHGSRKGGGERGARPNWQIMNLIILISILVKSRVGWQITSVRPQNYIPSISKIVDHKWIIIRTAIAIYLWRTYVDPQSKSNYNMLINVYCTYTKLYRTYQKYACEEYLYIRIIVRDIRSDFKFWR